MPSPLMSREPLRIGAYLPCAATAIEWAVSVQEQELAAGNVKPLGEILMAREQITHEDLVEALELQRIDRLRRCAFLSHLSEEQLRRIGEMTEEVSLNPGEELLKQGQRGDAAYMVLSGQLLLYRRTSPTETIPAGVALRGDFLGDEDFYSDGTRSITACAVEPVQMLRIPFRSLPPPDRLGPIPVQKIPEETGPDELEDRLLQRACHILKADRAHLYLRDQATGDLLARVTVRGETFVHRVPAGCEIVGEAARTGEVIRVPEAYIDPRFKPDLDIWTGYWTRTLLAGPLHDPQGAVIGAVEVLNKTAGYFTPEDEVLFRAFATQSAQALSRPHDAIRLAE